MSNNPIKRHAALQTLSREHHHGLLFCWKIREGFKRNIAIERIKKYADWFWSSHLVQHFETEEAILFPILPAENSKVKKAVADHRRLKSLFENSDDIRKSLSVLEEALEAHIRFEERDLFNEIQQVATAAQLADVENHHHAPFSDDWADEFWKDKK